ncbi:acyl-CoA carboxylase epsilon subunit [Agrococcus sp. Ld7]|uniref:acyl-CoA carboxylase epsilon subunit n=1 Tax=Agrococcus sp. Ld7 TaxID=649148 RepID=UPI00386BB454
MTTTDPQAHDGTDAGEGANSDAAIMRVVSGAPTAEEQAAVQAALLGLAEEWAETKHRRVLDSESEWQAKSRTASGFRWKRD